MYIHMKDELIIYAYCWEFSEKLSIIGLDHIFTLYNGQSNKCMLRKGEAWAEGKYLIRITRADSNLVAVLECLELPTLIGKFESDTPEQYFLEWRLKHTKEAQ